MGLFARIAPPASDIPLPGDPPRLAVHTFASALRQFAAGQVTRQQIIDAFLLTGSDVTELDALIASYQAMPTNNTANTFAKALRLDAMEDVFIMVEAGLYTEAKAKAALGF